MNASGSRETVRARLAAGGRAYGTMAFEFFTEGLTPMLANAGYEFVILDTEHSGVGIDTIKRQVAYARGLGIEVYVRPPTKTYAAVATLLDAGAQGIMAPMLETPEQARELVEWARYRPEGKRGLAFGMPHDAYHAGDHDAYMREANERILLIALIETRLGIANAEAILATPGIDVGWLGHWDLTNDMGITGRFEDPAFIAASEALGRAAAATGKTVAAGDASPAYLKAQLARGFRCLGYANDVGVMRKGFTEGIAMMKGL